MWIIGDYFTGKSVDHFYLARKPEDTYVGRHFTVDAFAADEFSAYNPIASSRFRNALITAMNTAEYSPTYVLMVIEDDIISNLRIDKDITVTEKLLYKVYNKLSKWLVRETFRAMESFLDLLPQRARRNNDPVIIWILPTTHKNYKNNWEREIFSKCLASAGKGKRNMLFLELRHRLGLL